MSSFSDWKYTYFNISSPSPYVIHVEINRPQKLNSFSHPVWIEFGSIFERISHEPEVRAVVFSGAGDRAFTAGLDVQDASQGPLSEVFSGKTDGSRNATTLRRHIDEFQGCMTAMEKCEKPVICVMHGISIGLAIDIACCADIRIASRDARFAVKEVDIGLAADVGSLARLPRIIGNMSWIKEVCLTARDFGAEEARQVGLLSHVLDSKAAAMQAAVQLATTIASKSPVAVQGTKELLNHARDHTVADNLRYTSVWNSAMLQSGDFKTALTSGLNKTKPRFEKL